MTTFYEMTADAITGEKIPMSRYQGQVALIVNVASRCGFTPQYKGLEALYQELKDQGLVVLGFPCNQFGKQEPGSEEEIAQFCELNYGVTFPMFAKVDVNGPHAHPLFELLKEEAPGLLGSEGVKWNFTKFVVDQEGRVLKRFAPKDKPEALKEYLTSLLGAK